ncbi:MAG TPA: hypothetical protein VH480_12125 [Streptosporangiaceae bacterium]
MAEAGAPGEQPQPEPGDPGTAQRPEGQYGPWPGHEPGPGGHPHSPGEGRRVTDPWGVLMRLADQVTAGRAVGALIPAWRRRTPGERRWPVTASVAVAIVLQIRLSDRLTSPLPHLLLPVLEIALGVGLIIVNPVRFERRGVLARTASIVLIMLITAANAVSAVLLVRAILKGLPGTATAAPLFASGASIWATNVIAFGLWYWEFDRGGPVRRAEGLAQHPDLMFPQMASPELAPPEWEPYFVDYLYMSFTNATAFSPTDVMPLARWAKVTMAVQSSVALLVGVLVIAQAVNILTVLSPVHH